MLNKATPLLRAVPRIQQARRMGHGVPAHWKPMRQICEENKNHMDFMPVPQGSWQEAYNAQQAKWNKLMLLGLASCAATYAFIWNSGVIYLHSAPPMKNKK